MANKQSLTKIYDELPLLLRIIIQVIGGVLVGGIYRLVRYTESKNTTTLIAGIVCTFTVIGNFIAWLVDLVTLVMNEKYTLFVD